MFKIHIWYNEVHFYSSKKVCLLNKCKMQKLCFSLNLDFWVGILQKMFKASFLLSLNLGCKRRTYAAILERAIKGQYNLTFLYTLFGEWLDKLATNSLSPTTRVQWPQENGLGHFLGNVTPKIKILRQTKYLAPT